MDQKPLALPYQVVAKAPRGEWQPTPPQPAAISWKNGTPVADKFDDVYYSPAGGLEEVRYVFHSGTGLPEAWQGRENFTIAELGFGTGLSFLATWQEWRTRAVQESASCLHYISFEKHPLRESDLRRAHAQWPELSELSKRLISKLPLPVAGLHRVEFLEDSLYLTLVLGEASEFLPLIVAEVDAWFLDGFSPARNPDLWTEEICDEVARLSRPGARLATFSTARVVRDSLSRVGFNLEKRAGFKKREMFTAEYRATNTSVPTALLKPRSERRVAIVGGGLAGTALAHSFAKRGWQVTLVEQEAALAQRASGNSGAVLMAYLSVKPDFLSRFFSAGYQYALRMLEDLESSGDAKLLHRCGVIRVATSNRLQSLYDCLEQQLLPEELVRAVDAQQASELSGLAIRSPGFFYQRGGWLRPADLCAALVAGYRDRIQLEFCQSVLLVEPDGDGWSLLDEQSPLVKSSDVVVLANGYQTTAFHQLAWLPVEKVRGQVQQVHSHSSIANIKTVLCYDGYILPEHNGAHLMGATYDHNNDSEEIDPSQAAQLSKKLAQWAPDIDPAQLQPCDGRIGFRTMSPDRLPILGPVPRFEGFEQAYRAANNDTFGPNHPRSADIPGLFVSVGHGSRGLLSCLLGAELIASQAEGQPLPLEADLVRAVDPCRFLVRAVKRGKLTSN